MVETHSHHYLILQSETMMRLSFVLLIGVLLTPWSWGQENPRFNVLFLAVDDMKDWVNCLGGYEGKVHTPNIDRLAERGMLFTNAHCVSPKCAPSRAALLTGLRPSTTGLYDNGHWWLPNLPNVITLPQHFRNQNYHVVGAGKIFHHTAGNHPPNQWDAFFRIKFLEDPWFRGVKLNYPWSNPTPNPKGFPFNRVKGLGHENDWGVLKIPEEKYDDAMTTDYVIRFLESYQPDKETPFFLACGLFRPHLPWYVPQKYFDQYPLNEIVLPKILKNDLDDIPKMGLKFAKHRRYEFEIIKKADKWKEAILAYLASITCADDRLGQILTALEQSGHAENTIIVLWSDHGWHLGEKEHWHKSTLWEESTRVPLIISVPGFKPGICNRPVSLIDLYPSLLELTNSNENPHRDQQALDGVSLVPLLKNPKTEWDRPVVIEFRRGNAAVRSERYRYIRYEDGGEELYDHQQDPQEWHNLASSNRHQEIKRKLQLQLPKRWAKSALTKRDFEFDPHTFTWKNKKSGKVIAGKQN